MCYNYSMKIQLNIFYYAALILYLTSGCTATKSGVTTEETKSRSNSPAGCSIVSNSVESIVVPDGGFTWNKLASIAAHRDGDSQLTALQVKRSNFQNRIDRAWRNPQLRLNSSFASENEYEPKGNNEHEDSTSYGIGLRFYISNPFVNRWIKEQAAESANSIIAQSRELSYAVYCETRMKCCEAAVFEDQLSQLNKALEQQKKICVRYNELKKSGYAAPLKIIKADLKTARTEQQIEVMSRKHRNALFQLALLTGLEIDKIKIQPIGKQVMPEPATYSADNLTASAVRMRPDLESIRCEISLARSGYKIAKAGQVPWFEFLESGYRNRNADSTTYTSTAPNHSDSDRDEWIMRTAISLPIFSWAGHETALANAIVKEAELRESLAFIAVRNEIKNALRNYTEASSSRKKMQAEVDERMHEFQKAVKELDRSKTVVETEIMDTKELLNAFRRGTRQSLYDCLKLKLYMESITGEKGLE